MTLKSDKWIIAQCVPDIDLYGNVTKEGMITPFIAHQVKEVDGKKVVSYGTSSFGYDIRVANEFKHINEPVRGIIDPKQENTYFTTNVYAVYALIPPNSLVLCRSVEKFKLPRNVTGIAVGKSTYARCGVVANITPLEAGWEGYLTIELSNTTPLPVKIYVNEGIAQILFFESDEECGTSYADKGGKYQNQIGVQEAKL